MDTKGAIQVVEITTYSDEVHRALSQLLEQLVSREKTLYGEYLRQLIASGNSHLFCAVTPEGKYVGTISVGIYLSPTGKKAWIEDVVVTQESRGQGLGKLLTRHAIHFARANGVEALMLTSNPSRVAANQLYKTMGFEQRTTNVYRMVLS